VSKDTEKADNAAAAWLARLRADNRTGADETAFKAWLSEDPSHAQAFENALTIWDTLGSVPRETTHRQSWSAFVRRREVIAGLLLTAGSVATLSFVGRAEAKIYQTGVGEQRRVVLEDGSVTLLDTDTRLAVEFNAKRRLIELDRGRASFHVAADPDRPFILSGPHDTVIADNSDFEARRRGEDISIVVVGGRAVFSGAAGKTARSGDRVIISQSEARLDRPRLKPLLAWQSGQAILENEKLTDAVLEMNRYSQVKLTIGDPAVGQMRISGVYKVGDNERFARAISKLLPLNIQHSGNQLILTMDVGRLRQG